VAQRQLRVHQDRTGSHLKGAALAPWVGACLDTDFAAKLIREEGGQRGSKLGVPSSRAVLDHHREAAIARVAVFVGITNVQLLAAAAVLVAAAARRVVVRVITLVHLHVRVVRHCSWSWGAPDVWRPEAVGRDRHVLLF